tara:strand:- start:4574 stop:4807 length:234 start_codon:yes stop_codon:yes gene_type:complete
MKPKSSVALILGGEKPEQEEGMEEGESSQDEAFENAADALMGALSSGDSAAFADALRDAIDIHTMGPMPMPEGDMEL